MYFSSYALFVENKIEYSKLKKTNEKHFNKLKIKMTKFKV